MPVMQPSAWQREYSRFNDVQQALLHGPIPKAPEAPEGPATAPAFSAVTGK
jgi:hypothetical protein